MKQKGAGDEKSRLLYRNVSHNRWCVGVVIHAPTTYWEFHTAVFHITTWQHWLVFLWTDVFGHKGLFTPSDSVMLTGQNGYITHSACHSVHQIDQRCRLLTCRSHPDSPPNVRPLSLFCLNKYQSFLHLDETWFNINLNHDLFSNAFWFWN